MFIRFYRCLFYPWACISFFLLPVVVVWSTEAAINPYENGCLVTMAEREGGTNSLASRRVCNSDDNRLGNYDSCIPPTFDNYFEVRIAPGNWEECK